MNRKLKKMLKSAYGSQEPENKAVFIQQIKNDRAWRRLHPLASLSGFSPLTRTVAAAAAVITVGTGVIAYAFSSDRAPQPPDDPLPVVVETTTAAPSSGTSTTPFVTDDKSGGMRTSAGSSKTTPVTSGMLTKPDKQSSAKTSQTAASTTKAPVTTSVSVYYTDLWSHPSDEDELRKLIYKNENGNSKIDLYGYPDYNIFADILRFMMEERGKSDEEIAELFNSMIAEEYPDASPEEYPELEQKAGSKFMTDFVLGWGTPPIVEGVTTGIEYIAVDGKPWTICDVRLTEVYNFDIDVAEKKVLQQKGMTIRIAMSGGYMPVREYMRLNPDDRQFAGWSDERIDSTVIYEAGSNQKKPEIGDKFIYLLDDVPEDFPVSDCYQRMGFCDIFQFRKWGDGYVSCNSNYQDVVLTQAQLDKYKDNLDIFRDPDSDRCIVFKNHAFLLYGAFSCYRMEPDGTLTILDYVSTDDGYYPFYGDISESRDELGRPVVYGDHAVMTWTDDGVILEGSSYDFNKRIEFKYPK